MENKIREIIFNSSIKNIPISITKTSIPLTGEENDFLSVYIYISLESQCDYTIIDIIRSLLNNKFKYQDDVVLDREINSRFIRIFFNHKRNFNTEQFISILNDIQHYIYDTPIEYFNEIYNLSDNEISDLYNKYKSTKKFIYSHILTSFDCDISSNIECVGNHISTDDCNFNKIKTYNDKVSSFSIKIDKKYNNFISIANLVLSNFSVKNILDIEKFKVKVVNSYDYNNTFIVFDIYSDEVGFISIDNIINIIKNEILYFLSIFKHRGFSQFVRYYQEVEYNIHKSLGIINSNLDFYEYVTSTNILELSDYFKDIMNSNNIYSVIVPDNISKDKVKSISNNNNILKSFTVDN